MEDFRLSNTRPMFLAGTNNGTIQTFAIDIFDDDLVEGTETFVVSGSVTSPAMFLPGRNMATITIMDNDRKCRPPFIFISVYELTLFPGHPQILSCSHGENVF